MFFIKYDVCHTRIYTFSIQNIDSNSFLRVRNNCQEQVITENDYTNKNSKQALNLKERTIVVTYAPVV